MLYTSLVRSEVDNIYVTKIKEMKQVTITLESDLSNQEIHNILESIFWDGEYFEDLTDVCWNINTQD